jgi:hypothetical protein
MGLPGQLRQPDAMQWSRHVEPSIPQATWQWSSHKVFFVEFFPFFSFGLLTAKISMFFLVMMKEANIIKDNTIRETADGFCHPWLKERSSKDLVWRLLGRDVYLLMQ